MPIQNQRTSAVIIRYVPHDKALARARRHIQGATLPQPSCVAGGTSSSLKCVWAS